MILILILWLEPKKKKKNDSKKVVAVWYHYREITEAISTKFGIDRFWVLWLLYFDIFYSGTEKQVVAYDYAERLANGVMECQVCFDRKSFFSLFMKNLIKIILKFESTN